jgi:DNA-binding transcriptional LysR family regulator
MMFTADELRAFIVVADERHFARAATSLGLGQSVVSKRLRRLEDQLGVELIDRSNRFDVRLTRAGQVFLGEARAVLEHFERAERVGRGVARGRTGPVRIGYVFSAAMTGVLSTMIATISDHCPELTFELAPLGTPAQIDALRQARLDFGIVRPRDSYPDDVVAAPVLREGYVLALARTHRLASSRRLGASDLRDAHILVPQHPQDQSVNAGLDRLAAQDAGFAPRLTKVEDFVSALSLAAAGVGVVLAPQSLRRVRLANLAFREIDDLLPPVELILLSRHDAPQGALEALKHAGIQ